MTSQYKFSFEKLDVWQDSRSLTKVIYEVTKSFPDSEKFGLVSQMRRASVSVSSNIAEGAARSSTKDYIRFLYQSLGSASELETQYLACQLLNLTEENPEYLDKIDHVLRMLKSQINSLKKKDQ